MSQKQKTQLDRIEEKLDQLLNQRGNELNTTVSAKKEQETPLPKETPFHKKP